MQIRLLCSVLFTAALVNAQTISPQKNANGKWALVDNTGKAITQPIYKKITATSSVGYIVEDAASKQFGLFDYKGSQIISCMYDSIFSYHFSDEITAVLKNKKYGFINTKGQLVLPLEYDKISDTNFYKGFVTVKKGTEQFVIDNSGKKLLPSPEPYETNYNRALAAANNSKDRSKAITDYISSIKPLGYSEGQLTYLIAQKFIAMMDIDYHGFFETMMSTAIKYEELKLCLKAAYSLSNEQRGAMKSIASYVSEDFVAWQNKTTPPPYPAGVPRPGFAWGKTSSSDKVFISQQSNISPEQKYNLIKSKLSAGQTVEAADISWSVSYENTLKQQQAAAAAKQQQDLNGAKSLIGKYITYTVVKGRWGLNTAPISTPGKYALKVIGLKDNQYGNDIVLKVRYTSTTANTCYAMDGEMYAQELLHGSDGVYYHLFDGTVACSYCNGKGGGSYNFSHTNDYQYTYGAKVTYSGSSWVNCKKCGGSGKQSGIDYKFSCL